MCERKKGTLAVISGFSGVGKGTIVEALVKTGDPVEFGTPLFKVETR